MVWGEAEEVRVLQARVLVESQMMEVDGNMGAFSGATESEQPAQPHFFSLVGAGD